MPPLLSNCAIVHAYMCVHVCVCVFVCCRERGTITSRYVEKVLTSKDIERQKNCGGKKVQHIAFTVDRELSPHLRACLLARYCLH